MAKEQLKLRSWGAVAAAYLIGPLFGLIAFWLLFFGLSGPSPLSIEGQAGLLLVLLTGGWMSLVVEALVVTPLLLGFRKYSWRWLNGWTGALIGFVLAALPWPLIVLIGNPDLDGVVMLAMADTAWRTGTVGLIAAIMFRLIAVRRETPAMPEP